jgi:hypothetical protein
MLNASHYLATRYWITRVHRFDALQQRLPLHSWHYPKMRNKRIFSRVHAMTT